MKSFYLLLFLLSTPWVFAQTMGSGVLHGTVTFADWIVWGQADLSAGTYSLTLEYAHTPVKLRVKSDRGRTNVFIPITILAGAESGHDRVCLVRGKERWQVRSLDLPKLGISLLFMPRNQHPIDEQASCLPIEMESPHNE